ncbi:hypothetical protein HMPREF1985_01548 [Mitsuokella sp. oral taxon 131 str. W9106]|nr:hypothetical protein HMPREF1985_01548 [Mitsuokella sp. oral taxon 131 str. W9106]
MDKINDHTDETSTPIGRTSLDPRFLEADILMQNHDFPFAFSSKVGSDRFETGINWIYNRDYPNVSQKERT